ncbi:MAG: type VI secretion system ATPase TssH, partial [Clostridia bacterium]|nr:type VI secretion system ATPase TssH [Clostridia bacterium]
MNVQKLTQKSLEALQNAQNISVEYGNQQIEQQHILLSLLSQQDGLIPNLLSKMGVDTYSIIKTTKDEISKLPKITVNGSNVNNVYVSADTDSVFINAEKLAGKMKDQYVSVEHIFISLIEKPNYALKNIFKIYNISKNRFLEVLQ